MRLFAQTFGAFIESTSYTQRVLKESVPPIFQSTEAFQTTMVGSKRTRSKTAAMAQSVTAQSYSSHDPTIDMAAPPPLAAMNPQQPPRVTETTVPPAGLAARTTAPASAVAIPSQGPVAGPSHLHSTTADFGPILEQLQPLPPLPPRSTHAPTYTSNETLARVQLGSTHFSPPDPRSQVDLNLRVDQLTQRMDDQNNLMRQLLNQVNLAQNLGLGQQGEERRTHERADRQFDGNQAGRAGVNGQGNAQQRDQLADMSQASASHTQSRRSFPSRLNLRTNVCDRLGPRPDIHARLGQQEDVHERLGSQGGQLDGHRDEDQEERCSAARS